MKENRIASNSSSRRPVATNHSDSALSSFGLNDDSLQALTSTWAVLSGIAVETSDGSTSPVVRGSKLLVYHDGLVQFRQEAKTTTDSISTESRRDMNFLKEGWTEGGITANGPYVSGALNLERKKTGANKEARSQTYFKAVQTFERAIITIPISEARKALSPTFKRELETALNNRDKKSFEKLFKDWGCVISLENVLGAEKQLVTETTNITKTTEKCIKTDLQAALTSSDSSIRSKIAMGWSKAERNAYHTAIDEKKTSFVGGSAKYHDESQVTDWKESIELPENWRVVRRTNIIPITDLLSESDQQTISEIFQKPLEGVWVPSNITQIKCAHFHVYQPAISESMQKEGWFYLGQSRDKSQALLIREVDPNKGDLTPVTFSASNMSTEAGPLKTVWRRYFLGHVDRFCAVQTQTELDYSLGDYFYCRNKFKHPLQGHGEPGRLCAVNRDLLAPARYREQPLTRGPFRGSLWTIESAHADGSEPTFDLQLFRTSDTRRMPSGEPLGLRKDCVRMLTSEEVNRMDRTAHLDGEQIPGNTVA